MALPIRHRKAVLDQPIGRGRIGDAQQGLRQAHEHHAFLRGQVVFLKKGLDALAAGAAIAHAHDQIAGPLANPSAGGGIQRRLLQQRGGVRVFIVEIGGGHGQPPGGGYGDAFGKQPPLRGAVHARSIAARLAHEATPTRV